MSIRDLQQALADKGFNPGPVDGVTGPRTRAAIKAFQKANGLTVDGIVGPNTRAALFGSKAPAKTEKTSLPMEMPWLAEAQRLINTKEFAGKNNNNKVIMDWAKSLNVGYASDEVAWCGLFVGHCVGSTIPDEPMPANILGARQWLKFGSSVTPQLGSVLVFWRTSPSSWKGHVGFYWAEDKTHYHVLGGNQSNAVNIKRLPKSRLLKAQWPDSVAAPGLIRTSSSKGVLTSVTEA